MYIEIADIVILWSFQHVFVRRLNMTDIERIAPLEEASMPYHLAETQKQVICYSAAVKPVLHFSSSFPSTSLCHLFISFISESWR